MDDRDVGRARVVSSVSSLADVAQTVFDHVASGPITPARPADAATIRAHLAETFDLSHGRSLDEVTSALVEMLDRWSVQVIHPRYFGLFNPTVTPASVVGDGLAAAYNPQLAAWSHAPAANEIERFALAVFAQHLGMDPDDPGSYVANFTTGGAEANLSALLAAAAHAFPAFPSDGVRALPGQPVVFVSEQSHHSVQKAAQMTGLGRDSVVSVEADDDGRLVPSALADRIERERAAGRLPFMAVATAGSTSTGSIDPLREIAVVCREQGLWCHVDAAWAGPAALSARLAHHLDGIELADSITCDAHKWLSVPMGAGMFFCRHPEAAIRAFEVRTPYMPAAEVGDVLDPFSTTVQWSRRAIGLKVFASLAHLGVAGYVDLIERQTALGDRLRERLVADGWDVVNTTPLPVVCFRRAGLNVPRFLDEVRDRQIAWMSEVPVGGEPAVRACVTSYRTTQGDIDDVVTALSALAGEPG
jgi:aromatic-L-amino-acid decarboxylase